VDGERADSGSDRRIEGQHPLLVEIALAVCID
jgi:hypothetical protein